MNWYLIYTKPKQEKCAQQNLEQQGYPCYLPLLPVEKLSYGSLTITEEPLFPRYLFVQMNREDSTKSWSPIRSTKGVSRLVSFGTEPAKIDGRLIDLLRSEQNAFQKQPRRLFAPGERVRLTDGAFAGIEGIYQMDDGINRVMVLIELLSKPVNLTIAPSQLRKMG